MADRVCDWDRKSTIAYDALGGGRDCVTGSRIFWELFHVWTTNERSRSSMGKKHLSVIRAPALHGFHLP